MNYVMKTKATFIVLVAAFIMASCGKSPSTSTEAQTTPAKQTNETVKTILTGYFQLKDALVGDDATKAKAAAETLIGSTDGYANQLNESLNAIAGTTDIETQRVAFETLSIKLYDIVKQNGAGMTVYKQFCPMAFDDKGAFWLSDDKKVMNPYFGASMLRCGSVKEELK
jgi:hypothetical protein